MLMLAGIVPILECVREKTPGSLFKMTMVSRQERHLAYHHQS